MKKVMFALLMLLGISSTVLSAQEVIVQSVTGRVTVEKENGKWKSVSAGDVLTFSTVIDIGLNSKLIVTFDNKAVILKAMQKGALGTLINKVRDVSSTKIIPTSPSASFAPIKEAKGTKNVSTAASRASNAAEDLSWGEDN